MRENFEKTRENPLCKKRKHLLNLFILLNKNMVNSINYSYCLI